MYGNNAHSNSYSKRMLYYRPVNEYQQNNLYIKTKDILQSASKEMSTKFANITPSDGSPSKPGSFLLATDKSAHKLASKHEVGMMGQAMN